MNDKELKKALEETVETAEQHTESGDDNLHVSEPESPVEDNSDNVSAEPVQETPQQRNFKALKNKLEAAERERDDALRVAQQYDQYYRQQQPQQQPQYNTKTQEEDDLPDDELIEAKHFKNYKKQVENRFKEYEDRMQFATTEAKIKARFPDFDDLVTPANLKKLAQQEPDIVRTLDSSNDLYAKAVTAYKLIKKLGVSNEDDSEYLEVDRRVVQGNTKKPRTATSIAPNQNVTPLSRANAFNQPLTDALKDKLVAEMEEAIRNRAY